DRQERGLSGGCRRRAARGDPGARRPDGRRGRRMWRERLRGGRLRVQQTWHCAELQAVARIGVRRARYGTACHAPRSGRWRGLQRSKAADKSDNGYTSLRQRIRESVDGDLPVAPIWTLQGSDQTVPGVTDYAHPDPASTRNLLRLAIEFPVQELDGAHAATLPRARLP